MTYQHCRKVEDYAVFLDRDFEILFARHALPSPGLLQHVKWIKTCGTGVDHLISHPLTKSGIVFTAVRGIHAACVSELVFAFLLYFQRSLTKIKRYQRLRKWPLPIDLFHFFEHPVLEWQTLIVAGLGAIGRRVARLGRAFGMRVLGIKRLPEETQALRFQRGDEVDEVYGPDALKENVARANYLVLCLPLTPETYGLISREILGRMKTSTFGWSWT